MATKRTIKVICVAASSVNGNMTNGTDPSVVHWTSQEDKRYFIDLIENAKVIIMGRKTYEHAKDRIEHKEGRLRIVLTSHPENYAHDVIPGKLEFMNEQPLVLLKNLEDKGYSNVLLVGGSVINTLFLQEDCVDELWITVEPKLFGTGTPLFAQENFQKNLQLLSQEQLNPEGTLLLKYKII